MCLHGVLVRGAHPTVCLVPVPPLAGDSTPRPILIASLREAGDGKERQVRVARGFNPRFAYLLAYQQLPSLLVGHVVPHA